MTVYTPMANGRDMTTQTTGTFAGSYKGTVNTRIGTFAEGHRLIPKQTRRAGLLRFLR